VGLRRTQETGGAVIPRVRRTQHTNLFQQAGGFSFARELAFSFNILPLTAKSGSYCDTYFLLQYPNLPATINAKNRCYLLEPVNSGL
jgi:hypothetical protein